MIFNLRRGMGADPFTWCAIDSFSKETDPLTKFDYLEYYLSEGRENMDVIERQVIAI